MSLKHFFTSFSWGQICQNLQKWFATCVMVADHIWINNAFVLHICTDWGCKWQKEHFGRFDKRGDQSLFRPNYNYTSRSNRWNNANLSDNNHCAGGAVSRQSGVWFDEDRPGVSTWNEVYSCGKICVPKLKNFIAMLNICVHIREVIEEVWGQ